MDDNGLPMPLPAGTPTYDHSEDVSELHIPLKIIYQ